jgi:hypothetical protein
MNHSTLKKFAAKTRVDLIEQVGARLQYVLHSDSVELREKAPQVRQLREALKLESEQALVERVAYIWFNRLAALRFMDAEGRHPFGCRVVTATPGKTQPELLQQARDGAIPDSLKLDVERMNDLLDGRVPSSNAQVEVYRMLVMAVCNFYHQLMPFVFEKIADYSELLLPEDLLSEASAAEGFRSSVDDADCVDVELIGWLYQYYISEKKDAVMARKKAVPKEDIPAVTQLFTPHWIVRYIVENSLGRLWMQSRPSSRLTEKMPYYIADAENNADAIDVGAVKVSSDSGQLTVKSPEEIRLIDPACGSGHILTYAFDLLYAIYEEEGYEPSSIPGYILSKNLHGAEIDERAAELAYFALMMKAQQHYGRFLRRQLRAEARERVAPQICCLEEITFEEGELGEVASREWPVMSDKKEVSLKKWLFNVGLWDAFLHDCHLFRDAKNIGSLLQPKLTFKDCQRIRECLATCHQPPTTESSVLTVLRQVEFLSPRYHCAVANPPYMGGGAMNPDLKSFVETYLKAGKNDSFAAFICRNREMVVEGGYIAMITLPNWMFLSSFEALRENLLDTVLIKSLIHCGRGVWGADFGSCAFVFENSQPSISHGMYRRLFSKQGEVQSNAEIQNNFFNIEKFPIFTVPQARFRGVPGMPIAYWVLDGFFSAYEHGRLLADVLDARIALATGDNNRFTRAWPEVSVSAIGIGCSDEDEADATGAAWFPCNKGGEYRRWYGNNQILVNWHRRGTDIRHFTDEKTGRIRSHNYNGDFAFRECLTWSAISSSKFGIRYSSMGSMFVTPGSSAFLKSSTWTLKGLLAFLCSNTAEFFLRTLSSTVNIEVGTLLRIPLLLSEPNNSVPDQCVGLARADWNNFDTSWDFRDLPLLRPGDWEIEPGHAGGQWKGRTLAESWNHYASYCAAAIQRMQELETENNRLWIDAYGLQDELTPKVPEKEITLARADPKKDMAAFISYATGCMFGRYSLDKPGLILANAGESLEDYLKQVPEPSFMPDDDNIIPVLDGEWFDDDIVARFREFLKVTFGEATLRENIDFIEESLGKDLRKYFVTDFYKDHLKTYKKRPIYWLFQSPKKSFQALIYLHRYNRDTVNLLLNDYLREFQEKLKNRRKHLDEILASESTSARDKTAATKEQTKIDKALPELADWEREEILPLASRRQEIDLDDGVKVNYPKFGKALAKIPGVS